MTTLDYVSMEAVQEEKFLFLDFLCGYLNN